MQKERNVLLDWEVRHVKVLSRYCGRVYAGLEVSNPLLIMQVQEIGMKPIGYFYMQIGRKVNTMITQNLLCMEAIGMRSNEISLC